MGGVQDRVGSICSRCKTDPLHPEIIGTFTSGTDFSHY